MNKYYFTFLLIFLFLHSSFEQSFTLTPSGLRDISDTSKNYLIINVANKSAKQIYDRSIDFLNETYSNPNIVLKGKVDSEYVRFEGTSSKITSNVLKGLWKQELKIGTDYIIEFRFKDNKVRFEVINLKFPMLGDGGSYNNQSYGDMHIKQQGSSWSGWDKIYVYDKNQELKFPKQKDEITQFFNTYLANLTSYLNGGLKKDW